VRTPWKQTRRLWKCTTSHFPHWGITGQDRLLCELGNQAFLVTPCRSPRHSTSGNTARASSQDTPFAYGSVKCMLTTIRGRAIINATVPRHGDAVLIPQRQPRLESSSICLDNGLSTALYSPSMRLICFRACAHITMLSSGRPVISSNNIERGLDELLPLDGADICALCQLDTTAGTKGTFEVSRRNPLLLDAGSAIDTASLRQTIRA
jgi:hypothetical protein